MKKRTSISGGKVMEKRMGPVNGREEENSVRRSLIRHRTKEGNDFVYELGGEGR